MPEPRVLALSRPALALIAALHAVFAAVLLIMLFSSDRGDLVLTVRRQFDDWGPLFDLYRSTDAYGPPPAPYSATALLDRARALAWCERPLLPPARRAPLCDCIARAHAEYLLATANSSAGVGLLSAGVDVAPALRQDQVNRIVRTCMGSRPVWRVRHIWAIRPVTPAVYALVVSAAFLWVAADFHQALWRVPLYALALATFVCLFYDSPGENSLWAITIVSALGIMEFVLIPGMERYDAPTQPPPRALLKRVPTCFWWCEYLVAPVFALYIPLMHRGRDFVFITVILILGTAVGGLGLRYYWCSHFYPPACQFQRAMQRVVWLGTLAASAALLALTYLYYDPGCPFAMGPGCVWLTVATILIALLQLGGTTSYGQLVNLAQGALTLARNVALFAIVASDLKR